MINLFNRLSKVLKITKAIKSQSPKQLISGREDEIRQAIAYKYRMEEEEEMESEKQEIPKKWYGNNFSKQSVRDEGKILKTKEEEEMKKHKTVWFLFLAVLW